MTNSQITEEARQIVFDHGQLYPSLPLPIEKIDELTAAILAQRAEREALEFARQYELQDHGVDINWVDDVLSQLHKEENQMSDAKPFVHGQEGTHTACNKRLKAEGGKARCCYCVPHRGCELEELKQ